MRNLCYLEEAITAVAEGGHLLVLADLQTIWLAMELTAPLQYEYQLLGTTQSVAGAIGQERMYLVAL